MNYKSVCAAIKTNGYWAGEYHDHFTSIQKSRFPVYGGVWYEALTSDGRKGFPTIKLAMAWIRETIDEGR